MALRDSRRKLRQGADGTRRDGADRVRREDTGEAKRGASSAAVGGGGGGGKQDRRALGWRGSCQTSFHRDKPDEPGWGGRTKVSSRTRRVWIKQVVPNSPAHDQEALTKRGSLPRAWTCTIGGFGHSNQNRGLEAASARNRPFTAGRIQVHSNPLIEILQFCAIGNPSERQTEFLPNDAGRGQRCGRYSDRRNDAFRHRLQAGRFRYPAGRPIRRRECR